MASQSASDLVPPRIRTGYPMAAGALVLAVSLLAMASWLLREPQLMPVTGYLMVFNTALCLALAAFALFFNASRLRAGIQTAIGAVIVLLAGLVLFQHVTDYRLGIDWAGLHEWLDASNPQPGRMAPATSVALALMGACFVAMHHAKGKIAPYVVRGLAAAVMLIGLLSLIGLLLQLSVMFNTYLFREVSLPTAVCLVLIAGGQWLSAPWPASARVSEDDRIVYIGALVVVAFGGILGLAGLAALKQNTEDAIDSSLLLAVQGRATLFVTVVDAEIEEVEFIATRPNLINLYEKERPLNRSGREFLRLAAEREQAKGFLGIEFRDADGSVMASAGSLLGDATDLLFALKRPHKARIFWNQGFVLHVEVGIRNASGRVIGHVATQQPLASLTQKLFDVSTLGNTGELSVCSADSRLLYCAPQRHRRGAFEVPRQLSKGMMPMERAIEGRSGTMMTLDYRNRQVFSAHAPAGDLGVGMMLKLDTVELFEPLFRQLAYLVPLMLLLLAAGVLVLKLAVQPLASSLRTSEQRLNLALQASRRALWDWDVRSGRIYLSEQWQALLGGEARPMETTIAALRERVHPDDGPRLDQHLGDVLSGKAALYDIDHRVRTLDGRWLWIRSRGEVIARDEAGHALRMTGLNSDITNRVQMQEKLAHQATHDMLTGLPNRSLFYDRLAQAIARSRRGGNLMAVMYLDIDKFNSINDTLGHDAGDDLLVAFSRRLSTCVRNTDTVARLGGDEYAVILETLSTREDGERIAEKIVAAMRSEFTLGSRQLAITTSVGLALYDGRNEIGQDQLIKQADEALYTAKGAGRDNFKVYAAKA